MEKQKETAIYFSIIQFQTYSKGVVWCPLEFIGTEKPTDAEFRRNGNKIMDKFEVLLRKKKRIEVVDRYGEKQTIYDKDTYGFNVATMELKGNNEGKNKGEGVYVVKLNNDLI